MRGSPSHSDFWAKLAYQDPEVRDTIVAWHPLLSHCADVAACAEALLTRTILSTRLAALLDLPELHPGHIARLSAMIALHDFGKANHGFQDRAHSGGMRHTGHLSPAIAFLKDDGGMSWAEAYLEALGVFEMVGWFEDPNADLGTLLHNTLCHHGAPIPFPNATYHHHWRPNTRRDPLAALASLGQAIRAWFPRAFNADVPPLRCTPRFEHAFNGLVTLADWLGSDARSGMFVFDEGPGIERMDVARDIADRVLTQTHISPDIARAALGEGSLDFEVALGFPLHPMQEAVASLPLPESSSLTLLESDTGSGKTEAAFAHFLNLYQAGCVDGLYFALPTRAAALGLHRRLTHYMHQVFGDHAPPITLALPGYVRVDAIDARERLPHFDVLWDEGDFATPQDARYRTWASEQPRRFLLGSMAVGTIDQALLGGLRTRHAHMRSTALLRHLLVVDEIHASDAYMTRILQELLEQHIHAGGHAFLMSATLGSQARSRLLAPLGRPHTLDTLSQEIGRPYPAVWSSPGVAREMGAPLAPEASGYDKEVQVELRPWSANLDRIIACAFEAASQGARVLILRNTVAACIETQRALEASVPASLLFCPILESPAPHHSRFVAADRRVLDDAIEAAVGRQAEREQGVVIVATQTVEQSLDIDVDLLLTDLCPMDVLLQRVGRVHRHPERSHPSGFERARVIVMTPEERDLTPFLTPTHDSYGIGTVYDNVVILEATWRRLERCSELTLPHDNRMLVESTVHPQALGEVLDSMEQAWSQHYDLVHAQAALETGLARTFAIPFDECYDPEHVTFPDRLDVRITTRLGAEDRQWVLPEPQRSPLGQPFRMLRLPAHLCRGFGADAEPAFTLRTSDELRFSIGGVTFLYDRLGIQRVP